MSLEYWNSLTTDEKQEIAAQASKAQDRAGRHICYWCGAPLAPRGHDFTSNANDPREICKGHCRSRRFFDNPDSVTT